MAAYPDRHVYEANYNARTIVPFGGASPALPAPLLRAREIEIPGASVSAVSDSATAAARDAKRIADLQKITVMLDQYRARFGAYPASPNIQTLCNYPNDAGCALMQVGEIPKDPKPGWDYDYWSQTLDSYVLVARLEALPDACSVTLPVLGRPLGNLLCIASIFALDRIA